LNQYYLAKPDHDARRIASADFGLPDLRSFRRGALGTIDALMAASRNVLDPMSVDKSKGEIQMTSALPPERRRFSVVPLSDITTFIER
jgi:hypothetical protein